MKKRHQAEEIVRILRDVEGSGSLVEGIRKHNISEQTYYRWKKKYGGVSVDEARRMRELEQENARLKKVVAEQAVTIDILKEISGKK